MSLEQHLPNLLGENKNRREVKKTSPKNKTEAKSLGKKVFPYLAALLTVSPGLKTMAQERERNNNSKKNNIEFVVTSPVGKDTIFSSEEEMNKFIKEKNLDIKSREDWSRTRTTEEIKEKLKKNGDHGDLESVFKNKKANQQEKESIQEQNVFNSFEDIMNTISKGKEGHYYTPHSVGEQSPYWDKKPGTEEINSIEDYKKHVEENLRPQGFKGELTPDIKYYGFKLEKNEFITTIKQDVVVNAKVIGGSGFVLLKAGTRMIFERQVLENGEICNILRYILDCVNPVNGDNPFTNVDGSGGFRI